MRIEEQPYDDRHNTPPRTRFDQVPPPGPITDPHSPGALTTREYCIVLNPDEDLETVVEEFIASAETDITGLHPLMWRRLRSLNGHPRVQVQGEYARVMAFERELNSQEVQQKKELQNGWIRRHTENGFEWMRVIWLPAREPAPAHCDMPGCEVGTRMRWAIAYKVACEGGHVPVDGDVWTYCQATVLSNNDSATFIAEK